MTSTPLSEGRPDGGPAPAAGPGTPSYRRTLGNRSFFLLWVAQLVSQSGDFIFEVALIWLVLRLTGSAFAVGIIVVAMILPGVVLGPFLGVFIDRWNKRRTLIFTNVLEGIVVAGLSGLVLAGGASLSLLFVIVLMLGAGAMTVRVATGAIVPSMVPTADLPPANSLLSVSGSMNQIIGLSIGGVVVALFGVALPIEYDALSFFLAAVLLLLISRPAAAPLPSAAAAPTNFRQEFAEGLSFIRQNPFMVELIILGVVVNLFGNGMGALFAPYAAFVLHGGSVVYGFLGAFVAGGSLVGAAAIGGVDMHRTAGRYLFGGGLAIGGAFFALGVATRLAFALPLMLALGIALAVTNIPITVVLQAKIPGRLLGRVTAAFSALIMLFAPGGPILAGWLAQRWSVGDAFLLFGAGITVIIGLGAVSMTSLRSVEY